MSERELTHLEVPCFVDFSEPLAGREVVAQGVGPDLDLWLVALDGKRDDRMSFTPGGASFAKSLADVPQSYEVLRYGAPDAEPESIVLPPERRNFHFIQPLPGGDLLLAGARCAYVDKDDHARNAVVYSRQGVARRELTLGDGIQDIQATGDGRLWVSYFDEGVLGNRGWGQGDIDSEPIGRSGLVQFDAMGRRLSEFDPRAAGTDIIIDCYALNVASDDETWLYFYTDFPLVRLRDGAKPVSWKTPVAGASAMAVGSTHVLFGGSYSARSQFELYVLHGRREKSLVSAGTFVFVDPDGERWQPTWMRGRGPWLYGGEGTRAFRIDLDTLVASARVWH
ncbi:hypothetical protein LXT21_26340 [Myxococcus sp. K38C18041901]|uniref:hypothetical protein n=1 Tax=Myxococcus guangdongensis TaxID=2906760 RepID=UPI0020A7D5B0|nr:hypothetical protein [Myxococcus guangdongensis]MCP3062315.1 hypothetical protein [Myxococcus guangdongensis]